MFHLEQGWWLGVKSCNAQAIYTNAEGRKGEVDISVCLAGVQANPWCVCFYLCADWWNELWVWEIDSGWGWSYSLPFLACLLVGFLCALISPFPPPFLFTSWFLSLAFSHWRWRLIPKCGEKKQHSLVLSVLFFLTRFLLAHVKLLHHFCFIWPASQILYLLWKSLQPSF